MTLKPGLSYHFHHFLWSGLDFFFPPSCGGCGKLGFRWCKDCQQKMIPIPLPVCEVCGEPESQSGVCNKCNDTRPSFHTLRSCVVFCEPVRPALIKLKYRREMGLGEALAWDLAKFVDGLGWQADAVLPIPLSEQRFAERGYNQVDLIAHPLSRLIGWQYLPGALRRVRHTNTQVGLDFRARRLNVSGAFLANSRIVNGKTFLLIDDVATTGSTLNAASSALLDAGANMVYALTFARALKAYGSDHVKSLPPHSLR